METLKMDRRLINNIIIKTHKLSNKPKINCTWIHRQTILG